MEGDLGAELCPGVPYVQGCSLRPRLFQETWKIGIALLSRHLIHCKPFLPVQLLCLRCFFSPLVSHMGRTGLCSEHSEDLPR